MMVANHLVFNYIQPTKVAKSPSHSGAVPLPCGVVAQPHPIPRKEVLDDYWDWGAQKLFPWMNFSSPRSSTFPLHWILTSLTDRGNSAQTDFKKGNRHSIRILTPGVSLAMTHFNMAAITAPAKTDARRLTCQAETIDIYIAKVSYKPHKLGNRVQQPGVQSPSTTPVPKSRHKCSPVHDGWQW